MTSVEKLFHSIEVNLSNEEYQLEKVQLLNLVVTKKFRVKTNTSEKYNFDNSTVSMPGTWESNFQAGEHFKAFIDVERKVVVALIRHNDKNQWVEVPASRKEEYYVDFFNTVTTNSVVESIDADFENRKNEILENLKKGINIIQENKVKQRHEALSNFMDFIKNTSIFISEKVEESTHCSYNRYAYNHVLNLKPANSNVYYCYITIYEDEAGNFVDYYSTFSFKVVISDETVDYILEHGRDVAAIRNELKKVQDVFERTNN